jgi:hypothetical protein
LSCFSFRTKNMKPLKIQTRNTNSSSSSSSSLSSFRAMAFLNTFYQIRSSFHFFGSRNNNFFYRTMSSALRPTPNLKDQVSVFMSPSDKGPRYTHRHRVLFFAVFYDSQGYGGGILTTLHMGTEYEITNLKMEREYCVRPLCVYCQNM